MNAQELVYQQAKRKVLSLGYTETEAESAAELTLERYKRNQFERATDFLDFAAKHAKQNFGQPQKTKKR